MDIANLIERITAQHSLINVSLSFRGPEASDPEYLWECSAQWPSDGDATYNGRGVVGCYGSDPVSAILKCAAAAAIEQAGRWPLRVALREAA